MRVPDTALRYRAKCSFIPALPLLPHVVQLRHAIATGSLLVITELHARMADVTNYRDGQPASSIRGRSSPFIPGLFSCASSSANRRSPIGSSPPPLSLSLFRSLPENRELCYSDYRRVRGDLPQIKRNATLVTLDESALRSADGSLSLHLPSAPAKCGSEGKRRQCRTAILLRSNLFVGRGTGIIAIIADAASATRNVPRCVRILI